MSAPVLAPRPVPRPGPGRPPSGRSTTGARTTGARTGTTGTTGTTGAARAATTRTAVPRARGATARGASARSASGPTAAARSAGASATARATTPRPATRSGAPASARPRMRVVTRPDVGPRRVGFAITCTALLGALMLALLLLNVAISGNAFTLAELQSERGLLVDQQQSLEQQLLMGSTPSALADQARGLGMVPAPQTIVIAPDGTGAPPLIEPDPGAVQEP